MGIILRRDAKCKFFRTGFWIFAKYVVTNRKLRVHYHPKDFVEIFKNQKHNPFNVMKDRSNNRRWWMFKDEFYWEDENFSQKEVKALILDRLNKKKRKVERAINSMENKPVRKRETIPLDIQDIVWARYNGKCAICGNNENIEYDHIIPFSKGGSNTARNIQILCQDCNRSKGNSIG